MSLVSRDRWDEGEREAWVLQPLNMLRAEVERLRVAVRVEIARMQNRVGGYDELDDDEEQAAIGAGQVLAYTRVLDLIDKHTNVPDSCSCGGLRWVNDENWFPEHEGERVRGRAKGAGLIPCGFCNDGGWGE